MDVKKSVGRLALIGALGFASACGSAPEKKSLNLTGVVERVEVSDSPETQLGFVILLGGGENKGCNDNARLSPEIFVYQHPDVRLLINSPEEMPYFPGVGERVDFEVYEGGFRERDGFYDLGVNVEGRLRVIHGTGPCKKT